MYKYPVLEINGLPHGNVGLLASSSEEERIPDKNEVEISKFSSPTNLGAMVVTM